ncbi:MAG: flagellar hook assembly protein FlgD [Phycisphaerae bacterium]
MTTNGITNSAQSAAPRSTTGSRGVGTMKSEDFFRIMVTELQNQDPLEPNKTSDMIGQVSQVRSIELQSKLGDTLDTLVKQQRMNDAGSMIGKFVTASIDVGDGQQTTSAGRVVAVHYEDTGTASLELDNGEFVPLDKVDLVTTLEEAAKALQPDGGTTDPAAKMMNAKSQQPTHPLGEMWAGLGRLLHFAP